MPKSKKNFPSVQLQSYLNEPRAAGSVPKFTALTEDVASTKEAAMREYLVAWEEKWKRSETTRYAQSNYHAFARVLHLITAEAIFGVPPNSAIAEIEVPHPYLAFQTCCSSSSTLEAGMMPGQPFCDGF
jgi:hypothetical protein